jgi:hypothetical protein
VLSGSCPLSLVNRRYLDIVMVGIVSALLALVAVIALGSAFGSF